MIILIDAYNLLKQLFAGRDITQKERADFLAVMGRYARRKKHKLLVVFDGGPYEWVHKERVHGVTAIYSGIHETADDYIKQYLKTHQQRDLLLVSADRELNLWASRFELPSIEPLDFYALVQDALQLQPDASIKTDDDVVKLSGEEQEDLDALMEQASGVVPIKSEDLVRSVHQRIAGARKPSKKDRKLLQKLKKL